MLKSCVINRIYARHFEFFYATRSETVTKVAKGSRNYYLKLDSYLFLLNDNSRKICYVSVGN